MAGRPAADRRRRRLHVQLHRQEPDGELHELDLRHQERDGPRPDHRADRVQPAQGRPREHVGADHPPAHLGACLAAGGQHQLRRQAAARGQRALPDRRVQEGQLHPPGAQPELLGPQAGHRRHLLSGLPGRRHHGHRPEERQPRRRLGPATGAVLGPQVRSLVQVGAVLLLQLGLPRVQLLRQVELTGQPGAARLALPQRSWPTRVTRSRRRPSSRPASG